MKADITLLPTDHRFAQYADAGEPTCICSRCSQLIRERDVPIRLMPEDGDYEYRFHPECLGFRQ